MTATNILIALSVGLAFPGVPEVAVAATGIEGIVGTVSRALTAGLQQAPGVAKAIRPTGNVESVGVKSGRSTPPWEMPPPRCLTKSK